MQQKNCQNHLKNKSMKADQNMERMYELLEKFEFHELSDKDKNWVLSVMPISEYNNLRGTLTDVEMYFTNSEDLNLNPSIYKSLLSKRKKENNLLRLLKQPIQFYKIAASVLVIAAIYSVIHLTNLHEKNTPAISTDTIYIYKTDTVYSKFIDTVRMIKEKIVYVSHEKEPGTQSKLLSAAKNDYDCKKEICPGDIDRIKAFVYNNNVSNDTLFKN